MHLSEAEVDVLRALQAGTSQLGADDLVWDELAALQLVERRGVVSAYWSLTMRGRLYKTD